MTNYRSALTLLTAPADTIISAADVKSQLNIGTDETDWDDWINERIIDAHNYVDGRDGRLGRALLTQQWRLVLDRFTDYSQTHLGYNGWAYPMPHRHHGRYFGEIRIPLPPLQTVDSVKYLDLDAVEQTVDPSVYRVIDGGGGPSSLIPNPGQCWPSPVLCAPDAVRIAFTGGYETLDDLKAERPQIRHAMLGLIAHWFQNREGVTDGRINQPFEVPFFIDELLGPHKLEAY